MNFGELLAYLNKLAEQDPGLLDMPVYRDTKKGTCTKYDWYPIPGKVGKNTDKVTFFEKKSNEVNSIIL